MLPLKLSSKKSFLPKAATFGLSEYLLEGSTGKGGSDPIHRERSIVFS
jgi:hypothetical protein